jgi:hypothetical protein
MTDYVTKPDTAALFINDRKLEDSHPDFNGKLVLSRSLATKLLAEGGDTIEIELQMWSKQSRASGKNWFSLSAKEPYKKDLPQPQVQTPPPTREAAFTDYIKGTAPDHWDDNGKLWITFQNSVKRCETPEQMTKLVAWIEKYPKPQPPRSQEIAQAIAGLIKKFDVPIPAEPRDLSELISKIDVETQRSNISKEQIGTICKWNFDKGSRALLSEAELCGLLEILRNWDEF